MRRVASASIKGVFQNCSEALKENSKAFMMFADVSRENQYVIDVAVTKFKPVDDFVNKSLEGLPGVPQLKDTNENSNNPTRTVTAVFGTPSGSLPPGDPYELPGNRTANGRLAPNRRATRGNRTRISRRIA